MIVGVIILTLVSILMLVMGWLLWKKEKITLLHDYHYNKVPPANKKAFCMLSGLGLICMGIGLAITAVVLAITSSALSFIAFAIGLLAGLAFLICASKKYNS